jgi:hypothetical protein
MVAYRLQYMIKRAAVDAVYEAHQRVFKIDI